MENTVAGLAALELGAFLKNTKTDIYLAALSVEAHRTFSKLASLMGEKKRSQNAGKTFRKALETLREKFWVEEKKIYAHALTIKGKPLAETTVWPSMPLFFKQFPQERAGYILDLFASSEMSTDWGIRSLSPKSSYYNPLNYNYGTVWPFLTGYTCLSEYNYGRSLSGFSHLMSLAHNTFIDALGFCPELLSGEFFTPIEESVPHQIFSSSPVITCLVRGLLGMKGNALKNEIEFRPNLPGSWDRVGIKNFRIGKDTFHFKLERSESKLVIKVEPQTQTSYRIHFCPFLGYGTHIKGLRVNGEETAFDIKESNGEIYCEFKLEIKGETVIEILIEKSILVYLPPYFPKNGDRTTGLKVINASYSDNQLKMCVEGQGGKDYALGLVTARSLASLQGVEVKDREGFKKNMKIDFRGKKGEYSRKEVKILFK
jgi:hypothetical protein